jgi:hypothetical protein
LLRKKPHPGPLQKERGRYFLLTAMGKSSICRKRWIKWRKCAIKLISNFHWCDFTAKEVASLTPALSRRRGRNNSFNLTVVGKKFHL